MADDIDRANELAEMHLKAALDAVKVKGGKNLTGKCHWCGEATEGAYCSSECRGDSEKAERMRR